MTKIEFQNGYEKKTENKWPRILRNLLTSLALGAIVTFVVVTLIPMFFGIVLIPADVKNIALLVILLTIMYFTLSMIVSFFRASRTTKAVTLTIGAIAGTALMIGAVYLASTFLFLNSTQVGEFDDNTYAVVVQKNSDYERISDLASKKIGILDTVEDLGAMETLRAATSLNFQAEPVEGGVGELANELLDGKVEAIAIEQGRLRFLYDEVEDFENDTKIIYTFKSQSKTYDSKTAAVPTEPFVVYISGIDQYGKTDSVVGRSDVNQLMVVNPETHKILLVNTPRDYYVQLAGTTGLKDKLTHAGIYGIETSIKTLEELYDVKIDYYVRVNFDSLINVVDQIGGIDIVSDQAFVAYTDSSVRVAAGSNHFNGKQALAYSRERYAYETGDRHRGENQQQVMTAIIDKVSGSKALLSNYNNILQTLTGSFQTNMPGDMLIGLAQNEFTNHTDWQIETISVDGTGSMQPTYSMGVNQPLYVMIPNEVTITQAKEKIAEVLGE